MTKQISTQPSSIPIVDSAGRPTIEFFTLIEQLTQLEIIEGTLAPNTNIPAKEKTIYWERGSNTVWFKTTGPTDTSGWVALN